jgi:hypothetical protein
MHDTYAVLVLTLYTSVADPKLLISDPAPDPDRSFQSISDPAPDLIFLDDIGSGSRSAINNSWIRNLGIQCKHHHRTSTVPDPDPSIQLVLDPDPDPAFINKKHSG